MTDDTAAPISSKKVGLDLLSKRVSLATSLIAILAAFSGIFASRCTTRGQVYKNEAIQTQEAISNEWAYYQSRNFRIELAELGSLIIEGHPKHYSRSQKAKELKEHQVRLRSEKERTFNKAKDLELRRDRYDSVSAKYFDLAKYFASALVIFQIALMIVPIVLIARHSRLLDYSIGLSLAGLAALSFSFLQYFQVILVKIV